VCSLVCVFALIPAFNEEESIRDVVLATGGFVDGIIVCDDGSTDGTVKEVEGLGVILVKHDMNRGYGACLVSLFDRAVELGVDVVVTIDGDGQHDPGYIPELISSIVGGEADVVVGSRFLGGEVEQAPLVKRFGVLVINWLVGVGSGLWLSDSQSGFRAYAVSGLCRLDLSEEGMGVSTEILLKAVKSGLRIGEVPVQIRRYDEVAFFSLVRHGWVVLSSTIRYL
jgi:glycosyltransferase involved in cell wall biosynthesis